MLGDDNKKNEEDDEDSTNISVVQFTIVFFNIFLLISIHFI